MLDLLAFIFSPYKLLAVGLFNSACVAVGLKRVVPTGPPMWR